MGKNIPRTEHLWGWVILIGVFAFVNTHPLRPHDFWWHIAVGREVAASGAIPAVDAYSFTAAGQPYPGYAMFWLPDTILYTLYEWGGAAGVIFAHSLWITAAYAVLFWLNWREAGDWRAAAAGVFFAAALGMNDWNVRPQGMVFLLGVAMMAAIQQLRRGGGWGWLLVMPLAMAAWVNSHGSFALGLALVGFWLVEAAIIRIANKRWWVAAATELRIARKGNFASFPIPSPVDPHKSQAANLPLAAIAFALCALATLFNPNGLGVYRYLFAMFQNSAVQSLATEWAPPSPVTLAGGLFWAGLAVALLLGVASLRRGMYRQIPLHASLAALCFALLGIRTMRFSVWFGLAAGPLVALVLARLAASRRASSPALQPVSTGSLRLNRILAGAALALGLVSLPWFKSALPMPEEKAALISAETPLAATQFLLANHPPGNLFHNMAYGSYLIWAAQPDYPVFVDSRIELYSMDIWQDYLSISAGTPDAADTLARYGVQTLMLSRREQPGLVAAARVSDRWLLLYEDAHTVIFTRMPADD